jgi:MEMO1 family protein
MTSWTRPAAVAGRFYPGEPAKLRAALEKFCEPAPELRTPFALIAPHAGYVYSGKFAGEAYRRTEVPDEVIVLCPNHTGRGARVSVWAEGEWETPLGAVAVAADRTKRLLAALSFAKADREAHRFEHAIEVHLPFLLHRNPKVTIVPVVLGGLGWPQIKEVGGALAEVSEGALVIASTDMSHYISAQEAKRLDEKALLEIDRLNGEGLYQTVVDHDISMCGFIPTAAVLAAARQKGVRHSERLAYGTSGEVTGDLQSVVAYASAWLH